MTIKNVTKKQMKYDLKQTQGITLVSLIVTIIVLLLLAGVCINMLKVDNGTTKKATEAKNKYEESADKEQISLAYQKAERDGETLLDTLEFRESFEIELRNFDENATAEENGTKYKVTINGRIYEVDKNGNVKKLDGTIQTGKTASDITNDDYGAYVNYGLDIGKDYNENGVTTDDWRIFYADGTNIYIISADYVKTSLYPNIFGANKLSGMTTSDIYNVHWEDDPDDLDEYDTTIPPDFMFSGYELKSYYHNSRCVSKLLNTSNWVDFVNEKADKAIGGPTIEMFCASWNEKLGEGTEKRAIYCNETESTGYNVGTNNPLGGVYQVVIPNSDTLYHPHPGLVVSKCQAYWLASPSCASNYYYMILVVDMGDILPMPGLEQTAA